MFFEYKLFECDLVCSTLVDVYLILFSVHEECHPHSSLWKVANHLVLSTTIKIKKDKNILNFLFFIPIILNKN